MSFGFSLHASHPPNSVSSDKLETFFELEEGSLGGFIAAAWLPAGCEEDVKDCAVAADFCRSGLADIIERRYDIKSIIADADNTNNEVDTATD